VEIDCWGWGDFLIIIGGLQLRQRRSFYSQRLGFLF
jgi:hypothetical protein